MIGKDISSILTEIETALWNFEASESGRPYYTREGLRAATKIFMTALMDKSFELQKKEGIAVEDGMKMAGNLGEEIRRMVKTYTDIDTHDLYK